MQVSGNSKERGWGLFTKGWTGEVLQFVVEVWDGLSLPRSARLEPRITKLLAGAIIERYEREERDWFCVPEAPEWNEEGKETSRTDIRLYPPGRKRRAVSFIMEGKRLNTPASNAAAYVGVGGMMCFIPTPPTLAKYAAGLPCGAMLGYVMDGNVKRAHAAVCKAMGTKRIPIQLPTSWEYRPLKLSKSHEWHGETKHEFLDGAFTIYHLLLPVRWGE
ncbi:MAG: hypothetical protein IH623_00535 [Verrucomicrobia bacterium]|nr:hypothetical protein [Verrucomicrobiota bacterium]